MNTSTKTTKIGAVFLVSVLIAGIIAISSPSFMTGAQAEPYYGMDNKYKKSKDVSVNSIKCNNINFNVNGVELNVLPPELSSSLASEAEASDEGQRGASSYGGSNGDKPSSSDKDFKFICINNNDNTVIGRDDDDDNGNGEEPTCDECFADISVALRTAIEDVLDDAGDITIPGTDIRITANSIAALCDFLDANPLELTEAQIEAAIDAFIGTNTDLEAEVRLLIECLIDAGVIIVVDEEPPTCDECFAALSVQQRGLIEGILDDDGPVTVPALGISIDASVISIPLLCDFLELNPIEIEITERTALIALFAGAIANDTPTATILVDCLIEAGVVIIIDDNGNGDFAP